ncbi:MAG TPA: SDR family oxidoreductase [Hyphomicrobiales bacterium]|nr:SDR family oxidoreductase [Hyphomicrobiales bacterium]
MDLGIKGRTAIVCAASKGLGKACAFALAREGVNLVINARTENELNKTADEIRAQTGVTVTAIAGDVTTEKGQDRLIAACPNADILVNNAGGPPPGDLRTTDREAWLKAIEANMLTPILLTRALIGGMADRKFGRVVNITSAAVKAAGAYAMLGLSVGARSGLTGAAAVLARQVAAQNVTINNLLPGRFETARMRDNLVFSASKAGVPVEQEEARLQKEIPARRFGDPAEFGAACAFLCSAQAGYITGQNIVIDGGAFPGLL